MLSHVCICVCVCMQEFALRDAAVDLRCYIYTCSGSPCRGPEDAQSPEERRNHGGDHSAGGAGQEPAGEDPPFPPPYEHLQEAGSEQEDGADRPAAAQPRSHRHQPAVQLRPSLPAHVRLHTPGGRGFVGGREGGEVGLVGKEGQEGGTMRMQQNSVSNHF